ncbi:hypothetical protein HY04AAS1_0711 [Hydrogenobaculum sp. Y04AAS1]|uniref:hypothetical protein n=1 Tax=Hydrogenobaculum sp. (strain Y04AAS1) TaxID=380749 RepID=UPI00015BD02B|nr:hypothetical protein HY04AAS1_0711 [Hydrogenobaculum sp. Y04AAS1]HCT65938.1 hypothetical protein [Hydrogenobaculum sp.]
MKIEDISFSHNRIRIKGDVVYNEAFVKVLKELFGKENVFVNYRTKSLKIESKEILYYDEFQEFLEKQELKPLGETVCLTDLHPFISRTIKSDVLKLILYTVDFGFRIGTIRFIWVNWLFNKLVIKLL